MLEKLKDEVWKANRDLVKHGLVLFTWGNASGIDREKGLVVIKPSGVSYEEMKPD
jgi:L-ribulose-5-phosphate 4-epimerase